MRYPFNSLTQFLAAWGALLSTLGLGWTLYRDLLDRSKLQVSANLRRIVPTEDGKWLAANPQMKLEGASETLFVVISVVNAGRRPVLWEGWGGKYFKAMNGPGSFFIIGRFLPKMLQEGETHNEFTHELVAMLQPDRDNVKSLEVWDAAGRHWRLPKKKLQELKRQVREFSTGPERS